MKRFLCLLGLASAGLLPAQPLRVLSPLQRIDPFGKIVSPDRGPEPRHILSPGVVRNGFASSRIVVTLDKLEDITLDVGQNPDDAVKVTLYRELFEEHGGEWFPDRLQAVPLAYTGPLYDPAKRVEGQNTATFWMDLWVARDAAVDRIKVEPQLLAQGIWYTYPMEVRIMDAVQPDVQVKPAALPPVTSAADAAVWGPVRAALCNVPEPPGSLPELTARSQLRRNALQHLALGRAARQKQADAFSAAWASAGPGLNLQTWCKEPQTPPARGPEWYLRFRDFLFQLSGN